MDFIQTNLIDPVNKALYTYVLVYLLVAAGLYFTVRTAAVSAARFPKGQGRAPLCACPPGAHASATPRRPARSGGGRLHASAARVASRLAPIESTASAW